MKLRTPLTELIGIEHPVVQTGMAGRPARVLWRRLRMRADWAFWPRHHDARRTGRRDREGQSGHRQTVRVSTFAPMPVMPATGWN